MSIDHARFFLESRRKTKRSWLNYCDISNYTTIKKIAL